MGDKLSINQYTKAAKDGSVGGFKWKLYNKIQLIVEKHEKPRGRWGEPKDDDPTNTSGRKKVGVLTEDGYWHPTINRINTNAGCGYHMYLKCLEETPGCFEYPFSDHKNTEHNSSIIAQHFDDHYFDYTTPNTDNEYYQAFKVILEQYWIFGGMSETFCRFMSPRLFDGKKIKSVDHDYIVGRFGDMSLGADIVVHLEDDQDVSIQVKTGSVRGNYGDFYTMSPQVYNHVSKYKSVDLFCYCMIGDVEKKSTIICFENNLDKIIPEWGYTSVDGSIVKLYVNEVVPEISNIKKVVNICADKLFDFQFTRESEDNEIKIEGDKHKSIVLNMGDLTDPDFLNKTNQWVQTLTDLP